MPTLEQAYAFSRRIARSRARNFYYSFALLPKDRRNAICAVYAFMRRADDIADSGTAAAPARMRQLDALREELAAALAGNHCEDLVLLAVRDTVQRYEIPDRYLFELIEGMRSDLSAPLPRSFDELYRYCYQAAAVVGVTTVHILGFETKEAIPLAEKCGIAFQLTNILRDIAEDATLGRVYFPIQELEEFGLSRDDFLARSVRPSDERFQRFMDFQWRRAEAFYQESAALLPLISPASRASLWTMVAIYHGVLERIRRANYNVLERRVRLTIWNKLWIVTRALRFRITGGLPPFPA